MNGGLQCKSLHATMDVLDMIRNETILMTAKVGK